MLGLRGTSAGWQEVGSPPGGLGETPQLVLCGLTLCELFCFSALAVAAFAVTATVTVTVDPRELRGGEQPCQSLIRRTLTAPAPRAGRDCVPLGLSQEGVNSGVSLLSDTPFTDFPPELPGFPWVRRRGGTPHLWPLPGYPELRHSL